MYDDDLRDALDEATGPDDHRLRSMLRVLRSELSQPPSREVASRHLAAIMEAVRTTRPDPVTLTLRQRVTGRVGRLMAATTVKVALGATAAAAATGGLAAGGVLGEPVKDIVHVMAESVGVPLPHVERLDRDAVLAEATDDDASSGPTRTAATTNPPAEPREPAAPRSVESTPKADVSEDEDELAMRAEPTPTPTPSEDAKPTPSPSPALAAEPEEGDGEEDVDGDGDPTDSPSPAACETSAGDETPPPSPEPSPSPSGEADGSTESSPPEDCTTPEPGPTAEDEQAGGSDEDDRESVSERYPDRVPGR